MNEIIKPQRIISILNEQEQREEGPYIRLHSGPCVTSAEATLNSPKPLNNFPHTCLFIFTYSRSKHQRDETLTWR